MLNNCIEEETVKYKPWNRRFIFTVFLTLSIISVKMNDCYFCTELSCYRITNCKEPNRIITSWFTFTRKSIKEAVICFDEVCLRL